MHKDQITTFKAYVERNQRTAMRVQIWACDHVASLDSASGDPRLAIVTLLSKSLNAAGRVAGARFAERWTTADTMVAAGGG